MSAERRAITYTPLIGGDGESRWIRLEQVQAALPGPSVAQMAEMVDEIFGLAPCDDGLGGGGEEATNPDPEEAEEALSVALGSAGQCRKGYWLAAVNVFRTHEQPGYELRSETATVEAVRRVETSHRQVVDVDGPLIALERPYAGRPTGIPKGVGWEVRGATVNLDRPVHDRLTLRYDTWHEYVTLRVPTTRTDDGEEYEPAAVVAFWGDMAAECELEPPEPPTPEEQAEIDRLCAKNRPDQNLKPKDCWKTIRHYTLCECSKRIADEWEEQAGAPCDGAQSGAYVGHEESFDGYVWCADDGDRELQDPAYYRARCCKAPPKPLPRCRESHAIYRGGAPIEQGAEHWRNLYGDDVLLRPVLPEDGKCGEVITRWNVPQKNCCADVEPLQPAPDNPTNIEPGRRYEIGVMHGKAGVKTWRAQGGIHFWPGGEMLITTSDRRVYVEADAEICPAPVVTVDDGCYPLTMVFSGAESGPPTLPDDLTLPSGHVFSVSASGGVRPYMWMAGGGLDLLGWSADGATAYLRTPNADQDWCIGEITVVDQCGRAADMSIYNADKGRWDEVPYAEYDPCHPPGAPFKPMQENMKLNYENISYPNNGYYVIYRYGRKQSDGTGSCSSRAVEYLPGGHLARFNCPTGNTFVVGSNVWMSSYICANRKLYSYERQEMIISPGCCKKYNYRNPDNIYLHQYDADWQYVYKLYRWKCNDQT